MKKMCINRIAFQMEYEIRNLQFYSTLLQISNRKKKEIFYDTEKFESFRILLRSTFLNGVSNLYRKEVF